MDFDRLLVLLLNENSAYWDGDMWQSFSEENSDTLWVQYLVSFNGGIRFEIWNKGVMVDLAWSVEDLYGVLTALIMGNEDGVIVGVVEG